MKMKILLRIIFLLLFTAGAFYITFIESKRYQSDSIVLLKDLQNKQKVNLSDVLMGQISNTMQDSKILELYIRSEEMFSYLDRHYHLKQHYTSEKIDFLRRLYNSGSVPFRESNQKNLLEMYNENLVVTYDDPSGTLKLSFIHTDAQTAQEILSSIYQQAEKVINAFSRENAAIALAFIQKQRAQKRKLFVQAIKNLIAYQNSHHTIDPSLDVERKISILTELETELVKSEVEYETKLKTFNPNSREVKMLKENIHNLHSSIRRVKRQLSGVSKGEELNTNVFDFELLKSDMEFAKEVYRQTLINQEEVKIEVAQQSKHLIVVVKPTLPDDYSYPNTAWDIFTFFLLLFSLYGVITALLTIVENHKD